MLVDARERFLDRAAQVIAAERAIKGNIINVRERYAGYTQQEFRVASLKSLLIK